MMTKSRMEVLPYLMNSTCFLGGDYKGGKWSQQENKMFENALAHVDSKTPDRWERVAAMLPGKTVRDVISHYRDLEDDVNHIEAGLIPCPGYSSSSFTLDWGSDCDGMKQSYCAAAGGKRSGGRLSDQERKKGVPWTEEEHKLFLMGLKKYGKGEWRNISRNFVMSRTPTQVASHAQKYFIRLNSGGKDKRRASIHDITTVNLIQDNNPPSPPSRPITPAANAALGPLKPGSRSTQLPHGVDSYGGIKLEAQDSNRGKTLHDSMVAHTVRCLSRCPP